jgi:hypothetical protein
MPSQGPKLRGAPYILISRVTISQAQRRRVQLLSGLSHAYGEEELVFGGLGAMETSTVTRNDRDIIEVYASHSRLNYARL